MVVIEKTNIKDKIGRFLPTIKSPADIYAFFKLLNYPENVVFDTTFKRKISEFEFAAEERSSIKNIYTVLSFEKALNVFLIETTSMSSPLIRYIAKIFSDRYEKFLLILTENYRDLLFVFPEFKKSGKKYKLKITKLFFERDEPYYTGIEILSNISYEGTEKSWRDVFRKWKDAFNVEKVTKKFFEDYKSAFFRLRNVIIKQGFTQKQAHEFTLQFLNRIMFIYFISKKRWLNNDIKFIRSYWRRYLSERNLGSVEKDSFHEKWLKVLFFKAFNNRQSEIEELPKDLKEVLFDFPYLNGGLFTENELDGLKVKIEDSLVKQIFELFEKYNFTIKEDMPLELEVAVDPQMIGYVYESLANVAEEIYDRTDLGIFYTPKIEVDFMCKRSLVEYLAKHLPDVPKEKFYGLVFDEDKERIEKYFNKLELWRKLDDVLDNLSAVDPACGSGAFLVGMMNASYELYKLVYKNLGRTWKDFELKSSIIGRSLYGVDVMPWAVHAAELRLWLQLIIETGFSKEELKKRPLLPNLDLNLRVGDSLVQEIGDLSLNLRDSDLSEGIKRKLLGLKEAKARYLHNVPTKLQKKEEFLEEEIRIFQEILDERCAVLESKISKLQTEARNLERVVQTDIYGQKIAAPEEQVSKVVGEIERVKSQLENLRMLKNSLRDTTKRTKRLEKKPFIWEIDFAEIFGDKKGFDIVIGNPPYVRQEMISPPNRIKSEVKLEDRREYKEKLIKSVKTKFPVVEIIDKRSDYYIYFYFHGLSLLNESGTFCFITSNSWLDVGYGKNLQEFLLKYAPIIAIYDNPKRSFAHADVNTIIALFGAPDIKQRSLGDWIVGFIGGSDKTWPGIKNVAKFVMFKKPFEEVLSSSKNLIGIEKIKVKTAGAGITELVKNIVTTQDYRVFPILQEDLLEDGWEYPEGHKNGRFRAGNYECNKWGGKYLRAPDIFYTILEKGKGKLVKLGDIAKVRFGIKTGANEFFYLDEEAQKKWNIEKEFLKPAIISPRETNQLFIKARDLKNKLFMCTIPKENLQRFPHANNYVRFGESITISVKTGGDRNKELKGYNNLSTLKNRKMWYSIGKGHTGHIAWSMIHAAKHSVYFNPNEVQLDHNFFEIMAKDKNEVQSLAIICHSAITILVKELFGRSYGGGSGPIKNEGTDIKKYIIFNPKRITPATTKKVLNSMKNHLLETVFIEFGINPHLQIRSQNPKPLLYRAELDKIIFDELELTEEERKEVYWAVCELVKQRLEKAGSLKT